jgi:hypothetical protein
VPVVVAVAVAVVVAAPTDAPAQEVASEQGIAAQLPMVVAEEITRRLNEPDAGLHEGDMAIPAGSRHAGNLAILGGDLTLAGTVEGDLVVVNGDLRVIGGAAIGGDLVAVGGGVENLAGARVGGAIITHGGEYRYEVRDGRFRHLAPPRFGLGRTPRAQGSDFLITTGKSYNRVEGMPIAFGPRLRTAGSNPLRLQALGIYRTESGLTLDPDRMGYYVRADQYVGGRRNYRVGATLHSLVEPIEEWQLSDLESGLATFLFHRDSRDHYERTGWSLFANWEPLDLPYLIHLEGRWEKHGLRAPGSPWSLFRNAEPWRPQPVVAGGRLGSVAAMAEYDTRSPVANPASGWLLRGRLEQALHVDLVYPEVLGTDAGDPAPSPLQAPSYGRFLTGLIDLRSYNRVDVDSRLNFRLVAGGSPRGAPLPPQRQHALGGEGALPGLSLFSTDCGARASRVLLPNADGTAGDVPFFPHYGCDAFGLVQAEFRGKLAFRFRWDGGPWRDDRETAEEPGWDLGWNVSPDWSIFVDAGRGWTFHRRPDADTEVTVGAGLLLDRLGVYFAVPVTGGGGVNLFVRLGPRF